MANSFFEKKPKVEFCSWASAWLLNNEENFDESRPTDLPIVVNLLRSLGYKMAKMENFNKADSSFLKDGTNGCKIVVTCTHSGQRCVLEQSLDHCGCSVIVEGDSTKDTFWEVTASTLSSQNSLSVLESGSEMVPSIPKELSFVIRNVLTHLSDMIKDADKFNYSEHFGTPKGRRSSIRSSIAGIQDLHFKSDNSPNRYRSLDTLISKDADVGFPEPGKLALQSLNPAINITTTISSPDIALKVDDSSVEDRNLTVTILPPIPSKLLPFIKIASANLIKALALLEGGISPKTPTTPTKFEEKIKTAGKNIKKLICTSKNVSSTDLKYRSSPNLTRRRSSLSLGTDIKLPRAALKVVNPRNAATIVKKITPESKKEYNMKPSVSSSSVTALSAKKLTTKKYAHVKSTITKPNKLERKDDKEEKK